MDRVEQKFNFLQKLAEGKHTWGAFYRGERLKSSTGKMSWNTVGAAKNAIILAVGHSVARGNGFKNAAELCKDLEKRGLLIYKTLS